MHEVVLHGRLLVGQGGPAAHDTERPPVPTKVPVLSECVCVGMVDVWGGAAGFGRATRARDFRSPSAHWLVCRGGGGVM